MIRFAMVLIAVLMFSVQGRSQESSGEKNRYANDLTGRLEAILENFVVNYDLCTSESYAIFAEGTYTQVGASQTHRYPIIFLYANQGEGEEFCGSARGMDTSLYGSEAWAQTFIGNGKTSVRSEIQNFEPVPPTVDASTIEGFGKGPNPFTKKVNPWALSISAGTELMRTGGSPGAFSRILFEGNVLEKCHYDKKGNVVAVFGQNTEQVMGDKTIKFVVGTEFVFSKDQGFMPTFSKSGVYFSHGALKKKTHFPSQVETKWVKLGERYVPSEMVCESTSEGRSAVSAQQLRFNYAFGKDFPKSSHVKLEMEDWREPLRVLFDAEWQAQGKIVVDRKSIFENSFQNGESREKSKSND